MSAPLGSENVARTAAEADRLAHEFRGTFGKETVARCVEEAREHFAGAKIEAYLPLLAYRFARELLRATAKSQRLVRSGVPEVLFVCVHNAGPSQMAAAIMRDLARGRVAVRSAGSMPAGALHRNVVQARRAVGLDPGEEFPKPLADEFVRAADVVVTMGCGDACPVLPGRTYHDWDVPDPVGRPMEEVRAIRDDIRARVVSLIRSLGVDASPARERHAPCTRSKSSTPRCAVRRASAAPRSTRRS